MEDRDIKFGLDKTDKAMQLIWDTIQVIGDNFGPEIQADYQEFVKQFRKLEECINQISVTTGIKSWVDYL